METQEFKRLLDKYLTGNCTPDEEQLLLSYYHSFQQNPLVHMPSGDEVNALEQLMWQQIKEASSVNQRTNVMPPPPVTAMQTGKRRNRWLPYAAAAIVMLAVAGAVFLYTSRSIKVNTPTATIVNTNDLLPGSDKAILTLADGSTIVLDSSANGLISQQGDAQVTKLNNGELAYASTGGSGAAVVNNTITTPKGGRFKITLPDGTGVWLNAASSLTYPTAFTGDERRVFVTGEAYFEVAKNATQSFHVMVNNMEVQVLGTHFNINAYTDESNIKTTLLEGSVKVLEGSKSALLAPGQQAVVTSKSKEEISIVKAADIEQVMAWKNGYFSFKNADIKTVMRHLARWYNVEVVYEGAIPDNRFEGEIPMDALASQVLRVLQKNNVHFKIEEKKIIVIPE